MGKEVELEQDKLNLIEKIIKNDRKFSNNEDLYDDFFNETCKRSLVVINTIKSDATLEAYIRKIATTSIINVLKNEGRLRRSGGGFTPTDNVSIDDLQTDYSKIKISYIPVQIQETPEDITIKQDILQKISDSVYEIDKTKPEKEYLKLYYLRYKDCLTQSEIAKELNISQSEVSKRLLKLMDEVRRWYNDLS